MLIISLINISFFLGFLGIELKVKFVFREGERILLVGGLEKGVVCVEVWEFERI